MNILHVVRLWKSQEEDILALLDEFNFLRFCNFSNMQRSFLYTCMNTMITVSQTDK